MEPKQIEAGAMERRMILFSDLMTVFNPNPGRVFNVSWNGTVIEFEPMIEYQLPVARAKFFLNKAHRAFHSLKEAAADEKSSYFKLARQGDASHKFYADTHYRDPDGSWKTKPFARQPLMDLASAEGQAAYQAALAEIQMAKEGRTEPAAVTTREVPLQKPSSMWTVDVIRDYLNEKKVGFSPRSEQEALLKRALEVFDLEKRALEQAGIVVVEID